VTWCFPILKDRIPKVLCYKQWAALSGSIYVNRTVNEHLPVALQIKRYILISFGSAVVGNIGGTDGAWDITVLGTPANVLSRLDLVTKQTEFAQAVGDHRIVLTREAAEMLKRRIPDSI
jgi:class 3 adenylate cyclase